MKWFDTRTVIKFVFAGDKRADMHKMATKLEQQRIRVIAIYYNEEQDKSTIEYEGV